MSQNALAGLMGAMMPDTFGQGMKAAQSGKMNNALAGGDYGAASKAAFGMGDTNGGLKLAQYGEQQQAQRQQAISAEQQQKAQGMLAFTQNMLQIPEADRGRWAMDNWQQLEPIVGSDFMTFWQQSGGDVSDQSLQEDILAIQSGLGQGPAAPVEGKAINDRLVNPMTGEVIGDYSDPEGSKLPTGMEIDPETGRPRFIPEYVQGQREIAEARGGNGQNVQSVQVLQNGEIALIRRDGTFQSTGQYAKNPYQISDVGGVPTAIDRLSGTATQIATPEQVGGNKATIETVVGNEADRRTAQKDLPLAVEEVQRSMAAIDGLLSHDGFDSRYGATSMIPAIPGTSGAGAQAYIDQIGGQAFLQAFQSLKGGGQITEIEGQKATQAITRLTTQGIPPAEARAAAQELKQIMQRGLSRSTAQAGGSYAPQGAQAKPLVFNPATGDFE